MDDELHCPLITDLAWGRIQVDGFPGPFRDAKLYPGGAREWDWRETGTSHSGGIVKADVVELVERNATTVVLGIGMFGRLIVHPATLEYLEDRGVGVEVLRTKAAAKRYNTLVAATPGAVGGLFHTTC